MKIKVKYTPNQSSRSDVYNIEDYGITTEEWMNMDEDQKRIFLSDLVEHEPPYWAVDYFTENE